MPIYSGYRTLLCGLLLLILIPNVMLTSAWGATDPRTQVITAEELKTAVQRLPVSSRTLALNLGRAFECRLSKYAYEVYMPLRKRYPGNANAAYLVALAAHLYRISVSDPSIRGTNPETDEERQAQTETEQVIFDCLEPIVDKDHSGKAASLLGIYLYGFANNLQEDRGMKLLRQGVRQNPGSSVTHHSLGYCLAMKPRSHYDPKEAEKELKIAAKLDPTAASTYSDLTLLYANLHRYKEAQVTLKAFVALLPPGAAARNGFVLMMCRWLNIKSEDITNPPAT